MKKAELLAPCGNYDCVKAAVNAGADAVYLGGQLFSARAYAANFGNEELECVCDLCHSFFVKVYVTVNTLYKDAEFEALLPFIDTLYAMGVDGLIMQDLGAITQVRKIWPDLPVHASTQLTANSLEDVKAFESLGLKTVVLSRELSLDEIRHIAAGTDVRIETFIHGALCVSYSGQCLMSSVLGNRSGNRGKCAQNCRLCYELLKEKRIMAQGHLLSTRDICTLPLLPELLETGVASLKIEGRMKTPEYVAGVTGIYRKYLDLYYSGEKYSVDPEDILILQQLFNRGAFSEGYLKTHSGSAMMCPTHPRAWGVPAGRVTAYDKASKTASIRFDRTMVPGDGIEIRTDQEEGTGTYLNKNCMPGNRLSVRVDGPVQKDQAVYRTYDKRLMDSLKPMYEKVLRKTPADVFVELSTGKPVTMTLSAGGFSMTEKGEIPEAAKSQALTAEAIRVQAEKLGGTSFRLENFSAKVAEGLFLNKSSLNALRNHAAEKLADLIRDSYKRSPLNPAPALPERNTVGKNVSLSVSVRTPEQFDAALQCGPVSVIYAEMNEILMSRMDRMIDAAHLKNKKLFVKVPRIWRKYVQEKDAGFMEKSLSAGADGFLISSLGHYRSIKESGKSFSLDFTANVLNSRTAAFWRKLGAERIAVSPEMSLDEINSLTDRSGIEVLVYGSLPLMVTHQCPIGNFAGGKQNRMFCSEYGHPDQWYLRTDKDCFLLDTDCRNCVCTIRSTDKLDIRGGMIAFNADSFRLDFTTENGTETEQTLRKYASIVKTRSGDFSGSCGIYDKSVL